MSKERKARTATAPSRKSVLRWIAGLSTKLRSIATAMFAKRIELRQPSAEFAKENPGKGIDDGDRVNMALMAADKVAHGEKAGYRNIEATFHIIPNNGNGVYRQIFEHIIDKDVAPKEARHLLKLAAIKKLVADRKAGKRSREAINRQAALRRKTKPVTIAVKHAVKHKAPVKHKEPVVKQEPVVEPVVQETVTEPVTA